MNDIYHETLAKRMGFRPYKELTEAQTGSLRAYCWKYHSNDDDFECNCYYWKESTPGDDNWISYDVEQHNRIAAPHLRSK
jgi:hypothetical protein